MTKMYGLYLNCETNLSRHICEKLYLDSSMSDVNFIFETLTSDSIKVPAHKFILACGSSVFNSMFYGHLKVESDDLPIIDASVDAFREFLQFFYMDEIRLTPKNIIEVTKLCKRFELTDPIKACAISLRSTLTLDDMCWGYGIATSLEERNLIDFCEMKIKENITEIIESESFLQCDYKLLQRILELLSSNNFSADEIITASMKWAKAECGRNGKLRTPKNLRTTLGDLFNRIPFERLTMEQFSKYIVTYKKIFTARELKIISKEIIANNTVTTTKHPSTEVTKQTLPNEIMPLTASHHQILNCDRQVSGEWNSDRNSSGGDIFTAFSSNQQVLLRAFSAKLCGTAKFNDEVHYDIECFGIIPEKLISGQATILKGNDELHIILSQPVIIDAEKLYFINIYTWSTDCIEHSDETQNQPMLKNKIQQDGLVITFKTNHRFENDSITHLTFERAKIESFGDWTVIHSSEIQRKKCVEESSFWASCARVFPNKKTLKSM